MTTTVLLMCGSLQEASANSAALDVARASLEDPAGVEALESVTIGTIPLFNPDLEDAVDPSVVDFRTRIARSDAVIIAAPEYAGALPGALKNALDWVVGSGDFYGKPVALISAGSTGGEHVRQQLIRTLSWQGAHLIAHLGIASPRTKSDDNGRFTDPATIDEIRQLTTQLLEVFDMSDDQRVARVTAVTAAAGVDPPGIAPISQR